jgi:hypothetical protein
VGEKLLQSCIIQVVLVTWGGGGATYYGAAGVVVMGGGAAPAPPLAAWGASSIRVAEKTRKEICIVSTWHTVRNIVSTDLFF